MGGDDTDRRASRAATRHCVAAEQSEDPIRTVGLLRPAIVPQVSEDDRSNPPLDDAPIIHLSAVVEDRVVIGTGTKVWSNVYIRSGARIGRNCVFGRNSFVDLDVVIGDCVKVQNNASLYEGVQLADGVFVGPHVIFTNDKIPRAVTPDGRLKTTDDWQLEKTFVRFGAAIGAGAVIVAGVEIGRWAMVGSGSVVTHNIPDRGLAVGNPARVIGYVSAAGARCETVDQARLLTVKEQT